MFTPVSVAVVADLYKEKRGERMGTLSSFTLIGRLLAPLTGGFLIYSYSFEAVFVVCFIAGAIAFFGISRLKIETENIISWSSSSATTILSNLKIVMTNHELLSIGLIQALTYLTMQGIETFFPLYASGLNLDSRSIGMILTIELTTTALFNPFMGKISDEIGRLPTIVLGTVIASLGLASLYILKTPILIVISIIVYATGIVGITTSIYPLASELVGKETYGSAIGAIETIRDVGQALGPILSGIISQVLKSYDVIFVFLAIIMFINIIVSLAVLNAE
jgi:MFS family permease